MAQETTSEAPEATTEEEDTEDESSTTKKDNTTSTKKKTSKKSKSSKTGDNSQIMLYLAIGTCKWMRYCLFCKKKSNKIINVNQNTHL